MSAVTSSGNGPLPSILDREVSNRAGDAFGHQLYADALAGLIETAQHSPPYSIGLLGTWGTGKSTIKQLYLSSLEEDQNGTPEHRRRDRIKAITFNAWRYGGEGDLRRALLRHVFLALDGDEVEIRRKLYEQITRSTHSVKPFGDWFKEAALQNIANLAIFILLLAFTLGCAWGFATLVGITGNTGVFLGAAAIFITPLLAKYVVDLRLKSPTFFTPVTSISFPVTSAEQYEQLLLERLTEFRKSKQGKSSERLVIFVDDLDRLSASEMVAGLDAVRTFLEIPESALPSNFGVVFVISCDEDRIADALAKRDRSGARDTPGSVFTRADAKRFLDRLFQFRLEIPPFPKMDMRQYAYEKLKSTGRISSQIGKTGVRVQDVVDRLIHVGVQSPRNAIQLVNAFTQTWWIASEREHAGAGSVSSGALYSGAVTAHPLTLAALCVLKVDFPDFYRELETQPELLLAFNRIVFGGEPGTALSLALQDGLRKFLVSDSDGALGREVKSEYRPLRQYLSSLQGLRWPSRLQPLLLLAEDPITRSLGDHAAALNESFVSGDVSGALEVLGHHLDNEPLGTDQIRLLEELSENVLQDTEARRVNSARVLAAIAERIPANSQRGIMTPLTRELMQLKPVRINVGPAAAQKIIEYTPANDQRDVADRFSTDFLDGAPIQWQLASGETPRLEEIVSLTKSAVDLVLKVRREHQLLASTESRLRRWLIQRDVRFGSDSQTLPFSLLNDWISTDRDSLLELLGIEYVDQAITQLSDDGADVDESEVLGRIGVVTERFESRGQESRVSVWKQLVRLVSLTRAKAVGLAFDLAGSYADRAPTAEKTSFIVAGAERLNKEMLDAASWKLDRQVVTDRFLSLALQWAAEIQQAGWEAVAPLLPLWSKDESTIQFLRRASSIMATTQPKAWNSAASAIIDNVLSIPDEAIKEIAARFAHLEKANKTKLVQKLDEIIGPNAVNQKAASVYFAIVSQIPDAFWDEPPLQPHVTRLLERLAAMTGQPSYVVALFPAVPKLLRHASPGAGGTFLNQIFEQAAGAPDAYTSMHAIMAENWPTEDQKLGNYNPAHLAQRALQFVNDHPSIKNVIDVFQSLVALVNAGLAPATTKDGISGAATKLWPYSASAVLDNGDIVVPNLSRENVKTIFTGKQPNDESQSPLRHAMERIARSIDGPTAVSYASDLLGAPPVAMDGHPDGVFRQWMATLGQGEAEAAKALFSAENLNEDQRVRVLHYAIGRASELGLPTFVDVLPVAIRRGGTELAATISNFSAIESLAKTAEGKSQLALSIIPVLPTVSNEALSFFARAIHRLGGGGALERESNVIKSLDEGQLAVLSQTFPSLRKFQAQ